MEMRPRDIVTTIGERTEKDVKIFHVTLLHKPTRLKGDGEGTDLESARARAQRILDDAVEAFESEENVLGDLR